MDSKTDSKFAYIIDQSLVDSSGHHLEVTNTLKDQFVKSGYKTFVFCNKRADATLAKENNFSSHFSQRWNERTGLQSLVILILLIFNTLGIKLKFLFLKNTFGRELSELVLNTNPTAQNIFVVHTLNLIQFGELLFISLLNKAYKNTTFEVVLRFDPRDGNSKILKHFYFLLLKLTLKKTNCVRLFSDTKSLAKKYSQVLEHPVGFMDIPITVPQELICKRPNDYIASYLGDARIEKGFHLLPYIIKETLALNNKIIFVIQVNVVSKNLHEPLITSSLDEVKKLSQDYPNNIELLNGSLSVENYYQALMDSHFILIPYDKDAYKYRSSGIFAQAIALGKKAVVPSGSSFADETNNKNVVQFGTYLEIPNLIADITSL